MRWQAFPNETFRVAAGVVFALTVVAGGVFQPTLGRAQGEPPAAADAPREQIEIPDQPETIDPATFMPEALAARVTADFSDSSLGEIAQWLREERGLAVLFDQGALAGEGILSSDPVHDVLEDVPLYLLLNRLRVLGLGWYMEDDVLHVTTTATVESRLVTESYVVGELFDAGFAPGDLLEAISDVALDRGGGTEDLGSVQLLGDVLFVLHSRPVHHEVAGLLEALKEHGRRTFILDPPQHAALRAALKETVTADFRDTPLVAALADLALQSGADLRLDLRALRARGLRGREPVTLTLPERRLSTVLTVLLADFGLTWTLQDGVLWITSRAAADRHLKTALFDVRDLCRDKNESWALADAVESQTSPMSWEVAGGPGMIVFPRPGTMLVRQTEHVLDEVAELLERYRYALQTSRPRRPEEPDPDEVLTRYYRMEAPMAEDVARWLPLLVEPESWKSDERPEAPGTVVYVTSGSELRNGRRAVAGEGEASALVVRYAVLIVDQTRRAHGDIAEMIRRIERGDTPVEAIDAMAAPAAMGGMGGFGSGIVAP